MNFKLQHRFFILCMLAGWVAGLSQASAVETELRYLSGHGPKDAVPWEFCVSKGRRAGEWTTIPVPSNWEQHGFGGYDYGQSTQGRADEHGLYRLRFTVPDPWQGRRVRIVFDGVMTDAAVKINGQSAGPVHQGGFYRFRHDITELLKPGQENLLEVDVSKVSANASAELAERHGDYWVFGGIFRQVFLEAMPAQFIEHVAVDAGADGVFKGNVELGQVSDADQIVGQILSLDGQLVGEPFSAPLPTDGSGRVLLSTQVAGPRLWTAETPSLYQARISLRKAGVEVHAVTQRFGFRTLETRAGEGIFLNGKRILLKGVCRHSFRPETGRALDPEDCYEDVRLIKEMNMNAVRMSHYPPDVAFLEACDELGLYVLNELSGWQRALDTELGKKLVKEMVMRDVNHPSILFWDNGNEGGWNLELDGEFAIYDPQKRLVLHPWETMNGVDTKHYPKFDDLTRRLAGSNVVMPTEMLHGLYDGGAGAGLEDYWNAISKSKVGGGAFIWVLADEGIKRTDQGGRIDVFSTYAPDGIVGPQHEREASFYTVRDLYSPVQIDAPVLDAKFHGALAVHNRYSFRSLAGCKFHWSLLKFPSPQEKKTMATVMESGSLAGPDLAPGADGLLALNLPARWLEADALSLVASDSDGKELWTWTWPILVPHVATAEPTKAKAKVSLTTTQVAITLKSGNRSASFDSKTGMLRSLRHGDQVSSLTNGPRVVFARPAKGETPWLDADLAPASDSAATLLWKPETPQVLNLLEIVLDQPKTINWAGFKLEISSAGGVWKTLYDATRRSGDGNTYEFPPQLVAAVRISGIRQSNGPPVTVKRMRVAYQSDRFPAPATAAAKISHGADWLESAAADGSSRFRWTMLAGGDLRLDYGYNLDDEFIYQGITFDHPEEKFEGVRWLGEGPNRVWQNRLRGTSLGVHEVARNDNPLGDCWSYPEFQGYFAGLRWARFGKESGPLTISTTKVGTYLRIGTPQINHSNTTVAFPAGDLSFLKVIPAMGSKFNDPEKAGPASQPARVSGAQSGSLTIRFGD